MLKNDLLRLIKTMSGSEKRYFRIYSGKQTGTKDYLDLFEIINDTIISSNTDVIQAFFQKKYPHKNFESTCRYLMKIITDCLVAIRKDNDKWFQQYHSLMCSKILMERSITGQAYRQLKNAQALSKEIQDNLIYYYTCSQDLLYWSNTGFGEKTESEIVQMHMNAKNALRLLHKIQEQSSLFDILKFRGLRSGKSFSKKDNEKLNDLLISELSLVTRDFRDNFESNKLHLLFQSFFFINSGDYKSSLKCFYDLVDLFENNESVWGFPPYDYLSTLEGVLDNLRAIGYVDNLNYYIEKLDQLTRRDYPDSFQIVAQQTVYIYKIATLIHQHSIKEAGELAGRIPSSLLKNVSVLNYEKLTELIFYISLISFHEKKFQKSLKQLSIINTIEKTNFNLSIYKVSRLLQIIIHYELNDLEYLNYEIRSYKRMFKKTGKVSEIEKLILLVVQFDPAKKSHAKKAILWKKISRQIDELHTNKYEKQILKYYNFCDWIKNKLYEPGRLSKIKS